MSTRVAGLIETNQDNASEAREFFRDKVSDYDSAHYGQGLRSFMSVRQECVLDEIGRLEIKDASAVADFGCGPGHFLNALVNKGLNPLGMDTSGGMLRLSRDRTRDRAHVRMSYADIRRIPVKDDSLELVCSNGVIEYLSDWKDAVKEFSRVLKPGGVLLLPTTNALSPIGWPNGITGWLKKTPLIKPINWFLGLTGQPPVRPRPFEVYQHTPAEFRAGIEEAGLVVVKVRFFYFLPWPHPFDRAFPRVNAVLNRGLEWLSKTPLGFLSEGLLVVARKPGRDS